MASGSFHLNLTVARQLTCRVFRVESPEKEFPGYRYFQMEPSTRGLFESTGSGEVDGDTPPHRVWVWVIGFPKMWIDGNHGWTLGKRVLRGVRNSTRVGCGDLYK
jgi:hypothetical protein